MATICPKDGQPCVDDICRGSGTCGAIGVPMLDRCAVCGQSYSLEYDIDCACGPCDYEDCGGEG